ncbi:Mur ligase family protein [Desulfallas sp. Bu1-1]|uniref:Mur ligase family protein n=1 Tax=Desulfallas sp. Bu1-1 TaxID=2787620 RepID=UPI00189FBCC5|nr:Mur ligase family protein [Desulfallas sp. Bu1-1]MBF7083535.1 Mur ligase family protein [Desulfallas sp. Bu1-1]
MSLRLILAVLAAKLVMHISRLLGKGRGSSLPGMLALRICPDLLGHFENQPRTATIMVTGTNGKTTTNNMLAGILEREGYQVVANREGANLITGVATAFIRSSSILGRVRCDYAVLEVDEAAFTGVTKWIKPRLVVIINFFRDQLDRYGELDTTIKNVLAAVKQLPDSTVLILNADDPLVARLARESGYHSKFYGVRPVQELSGNVAYSREAKFCPFCGHALEYNIYLYSQLGDYKCTQCDFARPQPDIEAESVTTGVGGTTAFLNDDKNKWQLNLPVRGMHNLYNALAAFTAAYLLGVKPETAVAGLETYTPATGRMESFRYGSKQVVLVLVKNPTGFNQALSGLLTGEVEQDVMIAINDNAADGRDISWLWDVDFEILTRTPEKFKRFICSGQRAEDMALRLKYAGVSPTIIEIENDFSRAVDSALNGESGAVSVLVTYTALWPVEKILSRRAERMKQSVDYSVPSVS